MLVVTSFPCLRRVYGLSIDLVCLLSCRVSDRHDRVHQLEDMVGKRVDARIVDYLVTT